MKERSFLALVAVAAFGWNAVLAPVAGAQNAWSQGLPPYSPATPGLTSPADAGLQASAPQSPQIPSGPQGMQAPPTGGFAGLKSRSGINPASLPTSPNDPRMQGMLGMVPKFNPDFLQRMQASNLPAGTVLTGILENDVSSNHSKPGDVFSIRLEDGFSANGVDIIPRQSKVLGSVTSVLSSHTRHGAHPGTISISLQTLIFPDGRTTQFWGFIEHNPLQDNVTQSGASSFANKAGGYGRMAAYGTLGLFTRKVGYNLQRPNWGKEMELKKGEVLPIKTNRPLDLTKMNAPIQQTSMPPGAVNGMYQSGGMPPGMNAIAPPPMSPNSAPGLPPYTPMSSNYGAAPGGVPGLSGQYNNAPMMPPAGAGMGQVGYPQQPSIPYPSQMEPF